LFYLSTKNADAVREKYPEYAMEIIEDKVDITPVHYHKSY